jgi:signal transduction histidine kinase
MIGGRRPAANERSAPTGGLTQSALLSARVGPPVVFWPAAVSHDTCARRGSCHRRPPPPSAHAKTTKGVLSRARGIARRIEQITWAPRSGPEPRDPNQASVHRSSAVTQIGERPVVSWAVARSAASDETSAIGDVLVVDDRAENLVAIEAALDGLPLRIATARSGSEALRYLLDRDVAVILLDVEMPDLGGMEVARLIRERARTRHVPIIFITAHDRRDDLVLDAYRLGAVDFLFEPITPEILRAKCSVLAQLQRRTSQVAAQAAVIREQERAAQGHALAAQRRRIEKEALHLRVEVEKRHAEVLRETNARWVDALTELERVNARLSADDRRKNEFIAVLAHELRNPLVPITAGLDILDSSNDAATVAHVRPAMRRQVDHLVRLVDDLSRVTSGKIDLRREAVDVADVVGRAAEMCRPLIDGKGHRLVVDMNAEMESVRVDGDPVRLAQVVSNLLNNAARYTEPGGRIELACRREGGEILIRVTDDGVGIEPAQLEHVFEMFAQAHGHGHGLGIGLTLVARIVELHGGTVTAHSEGHGKGSRFDVRVPVPEAGIEHLPEIEAEEPSRPLRIALVEDNEDVRDMMRFLLESWGHEVVGEAGTTQGGIDMLVSTRPDVALVDLGLPDLPGYEVARRVRAELGDARPRLVAFSGFNRSEDRRASAEAGFDEHLPKPVRNGQLKRALRAS